MTFGKHVSRLVSAVMVFMASWHLSACGMDASLDGRSGIPPTTAPDGGREQTCNNDEDCSSHNHVCNFEAGAIRGVCGTPRNEGACSTMAGELPGMSAQGCYPGARCQPVALDQSRLGGLCTFQSPPAPVFTSERMLPKISVTAPHMLSVLRPTDGISLQWVPPVTSPDTTLVAVVLKAPPQRTSQVNRIANPRDIVWIWSSTHPGSNTVPGRVPLGAGHRSIDADGQLGAAFGRNTLDEGRYWWFVYGIRGGVVSIASDVLSFRVGTGGPRVSCRDVNQCVTNIVGELPDTVACIGGVCRRRCASNFDCPGLPGRCDMTSTLVTTNVDAPRPPRGGYCAL